LDAFEILDAFDDALVERDELVEAQIINGDVTFHGVRDRWSAGHRRSAASTTVA
jgi:hypothetical protein